MRLFSKKKAAEEMEYDRAHEIPVLRCSICNGEQVAGFRELRTGHFREYMVIRSSTELEDFRIRCGADRIPKEY